MDTKHIRTFVTVAREGNLTRAAQRLKVTQPAVSLQLKALQESLGLVLFTRTSQGIALTPDGQAVLPAAERVLEAVDGFQRYTESLGHNVRGNLRLGTILSPEHIRLGLVLRYLVERYPRVRTALRQGMSGWVARQIRQGELDAGFFLGPVDQPKDEAPLHTLPLATFSYSVIAPKGWAGRFKGVSWTRIAALPWIWTPPDSVLNRLLSRKFASLGVTPNVVAEVDQESSMLDLVRSGVGLSLARDSVALLESQTSGLSVVKGLAIKADLAFICLASRNDDPLLRTAFAAVAHAFE
jgi:DNA-binding transcriptional LysR family regulator